jgi:hypothetical protein
MSSSHLIVVAYQTVTTTEPPPEIDERAIVVPLVWGLRVLMVVAAVGLVIAFRKKEKNSFVGPPAVFSLADGWLTNLTGLSAAAVAVVATTDRCRWPASSSAPSPSSMPWSSS